MSRIDAMRNATSEYLRMHDKLEPFSVMQLRMPPRELYRPTPEDLWVVTAYVMTEFDLEQDEVNLIYAAASYMQDRYHISPGTPAEGLLSSRFVIPKDTQNTPILYFDAGEIGVRATLRFARDYWSISTVSAEDMDPQTPADILWGGKETWVQVKETRNNRALKASREYEVSSPMTLTEATDVGYAPFFSELPPDYRNATNGVHKFVARSQSAHTRFDPQAVPEMSDTVRHGQFEWCDASMEGVYYGGMRNGERMAFHDRSTCTYVDQPTPREIEQIT